MVLNLVEKGVDVVVYNRTRQKTDELTVQVQKVYQLDQLVKSLKSPRVVWIMVEHGKAVDEVITQLLDKGLEKGDILIDGGNSFYKDSVRRYKLLKNKGIHFLDIGTSGGLEGARHGACLMIGGDRTIYDKVRPCLEVLVGEKGGYAYFGPSGAGHFVKMVHNGVEYGMLQAIGEGFEILAKGPYKLDYRKIADNWNHGSVVRGWLMKLLDKALRQDPQLEHITGVIGGGSTGEWTVETAKELGVEVPVIENSLKARKKSLEKPTFSGKVVAALRREFGGHEVVNEK